MRKWRVFALAIALALTAFGSARAEWVQGVYWADDVAAWTGDVQNYGGELMTEETTWWLTGPPDADADGNGYAWDPGDDDFVAGWRAAWDASVTAFFELAVPDIDGADLIVHKYGGPNSAASVWASADDTDYVQVGAWAGGTPGYFEDVEIDFAGLVDAAHYIRVVREALGPQTGTFIDSFGMVGGWKMPRPQAPGAPAVPDSFGPLGCTPEPGTAGLVVLAAAVACRARPRR